MTPVAGVTRELAGHRAATLSAIDYSLTLGVPASPEERIEGSLVITFERRAGSGPLQLDFRAPQQHIRRVNSNGVASGYRLLAEHLVIPEKELKSGSNRLEIDFVAGDSSLNRNPDYLYTLFVPDRARTALPLFDQPDLKATWQLTLDLPADWQAIASGSRLSVTREGERAVHRFARSERISSYLFSFVAGRFDAVTRMRDGREMTMLHRETDADKVARNVEAIFDLHAAALRWLEEYTGIDYPFSKLDFALLPSFQYGGMEHVGAIQYRSDALLLDEAPPETRLLDRASLIAHEVAHMWFGNLVTMRWFDDVWTKEVFANFMAAKIVNPAFPAIDHPLNFLLAHYPAAYAVDRSAGANPIRQPLPNLNEAGQLYGAVIYQKAPIMMRQLEMLVGENAFRDGLRDYLRRYAFGNASWPQLIALLDERTDVDVAAWSEVWVNSAGRPEFSWRPVPGAGGPATLVLEQHDPAGLERLWPQQFGLRTGGDGAAGLQTVQVTGTRTATDIAIDPDAPLLFNADGLGYGLFPADARNLAHWESLPAVSRGAELINLYEQMLVAGPVTPSALLDALLLLIPSERNQLLLALALSQAGHIYQDLLPPAHRQRVGPLLERVLWQALVAESDRGRARLLFDAYVSLAESPGAVERIHALWSGGQSIATVKLAENDRIELARLLAIRLPAQAREIIATQLDATGNPDEQRRLAFIAPSLSPDPAERERFFDSLAEEQNRATERWVIEALENLHHPSRTAHAVRYIPRSLDWLKEIQETGDIFFPTAWLDATLRHHSSDEAIAAVQAFLDARPDYNAQLSMKIRQALDRPLRANRLLSLAGSGGEL
jgi:aminopeptidase N